MTEDINNLRINSVEEIRKKVKKNKNYIHPCNKERQNDGIRLGFNSGHEYTHWLQQVGILKNPADIDNEIRKNTIKNAGCENRKEYLNKCIQNAGYENIKEYLDKCSQNAGYENDAERQRERKYNKGICSPMSENMDCSYYLGTHVGERKIGKYVISVLFGKIKQEMPPNNPGFDFLTEDDIKIDVKTKLLKVLREQLKGWTFDVKYNDKTDYFLLIGLDNTDGNLEIIDIWLIRKDDIVRKLIGQSHQDKKFWMRGCITITDRPESMDYFERFSIINKLKKKKLIELLEELEEYEK